jgi:hypothetical protein
MYAVVTLWSLIAGFLRPSITPVKTGPTTPAATEQAGALIPNVAVVATWTALSQNASPAFGNFIPVQVPASLPATTLSGSQLPMGIIQRFSPGAAFTDCTDTGTNIVNAIPGAVPLQTFPFIIANLGSFAMTLGMGSQVTLAGTGVIGGFSARLFLGQVTGSNAVTINSMFGWGLSSSL